MELSFPKMLQISYSKLNHDRQGKLSLGLLFDHSSYAEAAVASIRASGSDGDYKTLIPPTTWFVAENETLVY